MERFTVNIKSATLVFEFEPDENIVLSIGNKAQELQKKYNCRIQMINISQAPPEVPRIIVIFEDYVVNICINRYEYIIQIPNHLASNISSSLNYIKSKILTVDEYLDVCSRGYKWAGLVMQLEYPVKDKKKSMFELLAPLYDRTINIARNDKEIASFMLQFGFKENGLFGTYSLSGYESYNVEVELKPGQNTINLSSLNNKVVDYGIAITVDVNNRPATTHEKAMVDLDLIIDIIDNKLANLPDILNIRGIIDE